MRPYQPFQHTAARRRLGLAAIVGIFPELFQHTAARRRLGFHQTQTPNVRLFQHTAARRRLAFPILNQFRSGCFNTQPPEGGWSTFPDYVRPIAASFNTQPPEGGWFFSELGSGFDYVVSTHSRPKAAGRKLHYILPSRYRFNTQPPEGGWQFDGIEFKYSEGFNTQPPEGGWSVWHFTPRPARLFQHTAARRRLAI